MNKEKSKEIVSLLHKEIPNPKCELDYSNNFELLCAVMLSAQTTDKRVNQVTKTLFLKYSNPYEMMNANYNSLLDIIKSLGLAKTKAENLIKLSNILHIKYDDIIPNTLEELIKLPGVGRKTANVVLALGFNVPAFPVDTHVFRIARRLQYSNSSDDLLSTERKLMKYIPKDEWIDSHHLFLLFGRYKCKSINPLCEGCSLSKYCKSGLVK